MNKPWVGFLAVGLIMLAGVLELVAGEKTLGIFLLVMSLISFMLRLFFIKKLRDSNKDK